MARVTVEDCLKNVKNRFELVVLAAKRARQLMRGKEPKVEWDNDKPTVVALREIAAGHTEFDHHDHHEPVVHVHEERIVIVQDEEDDADDLIDITLVEEETEENTAGETEEHKDGDEDANNVEPSAESDEANSAERNQE